MLGKLSLVLAASLALGFVAVMALFLVRWVQADAKEMEKQHCVATNTTQGSYIMQPIIDGKGNITGTIPVYVESRLYVCDDHNRWR